MTLHILPEDAQVAHSAARDAAAGSTWLHDLAVAFLGGVSTLMAGVGSWFLAKSRRLRHQHETQRRPDPTPAAAVRTHDEVREAVLDERTDQRLKHLEQGHLDIERAFQEFTKEQATYWRKHDADSVKLRKLRERVIGLPTRASAGESEARILSAISALGLANADRMIEHLKDYHPEGKRSPE